MPTVYIIIYSLYHHVYKVAKSVQEGLEEEGVTVKLFQVPETLSDEILTKLRAPPKPDIPVITVADLVHADAFIFGLPTRFGTLPAQMKSFLDATGALWATGALSGKFVGTFFSTATQHGGQETTAYTLLTYFSHHGLNYIPLGFANANLFDNDEVVGGSPYGAGTVANGDGSREPSEKELDIGRTQGENFARLLNTYHRGLQLNDVTSDAAIIGSTPTTAKNTTTTDDNDNSTPIISSTPSTAAPRAAVSSTPSTNAKVVAPPTVISSMPTTTNADAAVPPTVISSMPTTTNADADVPPTVISSTPSTNTDNTAPPTVISSMPTTTNAEAPTSPVVISSMPSTNVESTRPLSIISSTPSTSIVNSLPTTNGDISVHPANATATPSTNGDITIHQHMNNGLPTTNGDMSEHNSITNSLPTTNGDITVHPANAAALPTTNGDITVHHPVTSSIPSTVDPKATESINEIQPVKNEVTTAAKNTTEVKDTSAPAKSEPAKPKPAAAPKPVAKKEEKSKCFCM